MSKDLIYMRSTEQIIEMIQKSRAQDEGHEYAIVHWCQEKLGLKVEFSKRPYSQLNAEVHEKTPYAKKNTYPNF